MSKFNIGDVVYFAHAGQERVWVVCPECLGSGRLRVILADETIASIECVCCARGAEGSPGKIQTWEFIERERATVITGMEIESCDGSVRVLYKGEGVYHAGEGDLFLTEAEAHQRATELAVTHAAEEKKRLSFKEKQTKTWAWNVAYHRRAIKEAERQIAYHAAKLNAAPKNVREADASEAADAAPALR